jgi:hypothetical protein
VNKYSSLATLFRLDYDEYVLIRRLRSQYTPYSGVVAFFSKARPNGGTFFMDHSALVGNRLGSTHISNELLYW